ncbi:hypothetical protein H4S01_005252 [Coemansia sp. RSA 2610]|nr:hypothetical protein H4S01_005252 [Coemansia sp. RSA 2610]
MSDNQYPPYMQHDGRAPPPPPNYQQGAPPSYNQGPAGSQQGYNQGPAGNPQSYDQRSSDSPQASHYGAHGSRNLHWVKASNGYIPPNAVQSGVEADGKPLFLARAPYQGGVHPGKVGQHIQGGGFSVGYGHKEHNLPDYEVLCGDASKLRWVKQEGALVIQGFVPVPVGHEETGEPLYAAKTLYEGSQQPGKCAPHIKKGMSFAYGHKERETDNYLVLAYAD